jgi:hypothetical protein
VLKTALSRWRVLLVNRASLILSLDQNGLAHIGVTIPMVSAAWAQTEEIAARRLV